MCARQCCLQDWQIFMQTEPLMPLHVPVIWLDMTIIQPPASLTGHLEHHPVNLQQQLSALQAATYTGQLNPFGVQAASPLTP